MRDGSVSCWGIDEQATEAPEGKFTSVSAGPSYNCGTRQDGTVACWGSDRYGQATAPDGRFHAVSAGGNHACGIRHDGSVTCWGGLDDPKSHPPSGEFVSISADDHSTCGVTSEGSLICWAFRDLLPAMTQQHGLHRRKQRWIYTFAGLKRDGSVHCWGYEHGNGFASGASRRVCSPPSVQDGPTFVGEASTVPSPAAAATNMGRPPLRRVSSLP